MNALTPADEALLLAKIAQQDQIALSQLYDRYARIIHALAYKSLGSREESEEVVLDVFAQIWRIADRFDPQKGRVDQWVFTLARSRIFDRLRKIQRRHQNSLVSTDELEIQLPTTDVDPIEDVVISERREQVNKAIKKIPPEQRQVIELAYFQGLSHAEIAVQTGLSLGTVKTRIRLGLAKLKNSLDFLI